MEEQKPTYFEKPSDFRKWLETNHQKAQVLWVGFYKKATKIPSITWPESVDEALCFGWIDGLRKKVDEKSYKIRFTPRRPKSHWSAVNIKRIPELEKLGLMKSAGLEAFSKMDPENSKQASFEKKAVPLAPEYEAQLKANPKAWTFYKKLAPSYKKASIHWVMSARQEATRLKRLGILIESSEAGLKIPLIRR